MTDKEIVKTKIYELSNKIKAAEDDHLCELYEVQIADLIIEYSIRQGIEIPLIKYHLYSNQRASSNEETGVRPLIRRKIGEPNSASDDEYRYREDLAYFNDFLEAIGEDGLVNPRFKIHPEIRELVKRWRVD